MTRIQIEDARRPAPAASETHIAEGALRKGLRDAVSSIKTVSGSANQPISLGSVFNYLRAAHRRRGLVLNFGTTSFQHRRIVLDLANDPVKRS